MDETHQSRVSDAAATRKRRSSILKNQRQTRTPFSELEFNVATPTDSSKSRRVSFSRRTGVAEFVTNEATTTWKNFYEEHNKSLELSGNDSGANAARHTVGHIGQTLFDRQFQEVDAVDFITSLDNLACGNINTSLNNFTEQLAALESTSDDRKLATSKNKFELSAFTDQHTKLFGDDLTVPIMGEMSGRINVDFSAMHNVGTDIDDLDEIERDLQNVQSNTVGPPPFRDLSEYIEVELNSTHVNLRNQESDMSITETIPSPKLQNVSRNNTSPDIKEPDLDKENKCVPDIEEPKMKTFISEMDDLCADMSITSSIPMNVTENVRKEPEKTIVANNKSEKRKTIIFDDDLGNLSMTKPIPAKLIPIQSDIIKANPNNLSILGNSSSFNATSFKNSEEPKNARRRTIVYERDDVDANMSVTVAIPQNIYEDLKKSEKRNMIVFDVENADMSITVPVPPKIENLEDSHKQASSTKDTGNLGKESNKTKPFDNTSEKGKTIIFDDDLENLSMTKPIPAKLLPEKGKTIIFDDDLENLSMTKPIPAKLLPEKGKTIIFDDELENLSMTKPIPAILLPEKEKTIIFNDDLVNLSMTKPIPAKLLPVQSDIIKSNPYNLSALGNSNSINAHSIKNIEETTNTRRRTIVYDQDDVDADMSVTVAIPQNIYEDLKKSENRKSIVFGIKNADMSIVMPVSPKNVEDSNKQVILSNDAESPRKELEKERACDKNSEKRKTIIFDDDLGNLSMTKPIPAKLLPIQGDIIKSNACNLSALGHNNSFNANSIKKIEESTNARRRTIVYDQDDVDADMSIITPVLPQSVEDSNKRVIPTDDPGSPRKEPEKTSVCGESLEKRKTMIFDDDLGNLSMTKPIPANLLPIQSDIIKSNPYNSSVLGNNDSFNVNSFKNIEESTNTRRRTIVYDQDDVDADMSVTCAIPQNIREDLKNSEKKNTIVSGFKIADMSVISMSPKNVEDLNKQGNDGTISQGNDESIAVEAKMKSIIYEIDDLNASPRKQLEKTKIVDKNSEKRKTILFEDDLGNLSMTKPNPAKLIPIQNDIIKTNANNLSVLGSSFNATSIKNTEETTNARIGTIVYDRDNIDADMSVTVAMFDKNSEKRTTTIFDDELGNLSMIKPIPAKLVPIQSDIIKSNANNLSVLGHSSSFNATGIKNTEETMNTRRRTIVYDRDDIDADMSVTVGMFNENSEKRKTIFDELKNLSMTKPIPAKIVPIQSDKLNSNTYKLNPLGHGNSFNANNTKNTEETTNARRRTIVYDQDDVDADMSVTVAIPQNIYEDLKKSEKRNTIVFSIENANMSITMPMIPKNLEDSNKHANAEEIPNKEAEKTIVFEKNSEIGKTIIFDDDLKNLLVTRQIPDKLQQLSIENEGPMPTSADNESVIIEARMKTHVCEMNDLNADVPIPSTIPTNIVGKLTKEPEKIMMTNKSSEKRKTVFDNELGNLSMTKLVPPKLHQENEGTMLSQDNNESVALGAKMETSDYEMYDLNADMSVPLAIPTTVMENVTKNLEKTMFDKSSEKGRIILFDQLGNLSITKSIPANLQQGDTGTMLSQDNNASGAIEVKITNNSYEMDVMDTDISNSSAISTNVAENLTMKAEKIIVINNSENRKTVSDELRNSSLNEPVADKLQQENEDTTLSQDNNESLAIESEMNTNDYEMDVSIPSDIPTNASRNLTKEPEKTIMFDKNSEKRRTILDDQLGNLSITKSIPAKLQHLSIENEGTILSLDNNESVVSHTNKDIVVCKVFTDDNSEIKIPRYLKNVAGDIKSLMNDLVKPMADVMPFSSTLDKNLKKSDTSTCNTETQANVVTSSQIDLTVQHDENIEMFTVIDEARSLISSKNEVGSESDNIQNKTSLLDCQSDKLSQVDVFNPKEISFRPQRAAPETVLSGDLIFDYHNPLNNVLLVPLDNTKVHKYNPTRSNDTLCGSEHSNSVQCMLNDTEVHKVTVHYDIDNDNTAKMDNDRIPDTQSFLSNISKPGSIDQAIDAKLTEVKDSEVNTLIAMKENSELLQASSSLTLVDDALPRSTLNSDIETQRTNSHVNVSTSRISPVKVIYKISSEETSHQNDSDMISNSEETDAYKDTSKSKKRSYSPQQEKCKNSSKTKLDLTPKPVSKMKKISNSPNTLKHIAVAHFNESNSVLTDKVRKVETNSVTSVKEKKKSPQKSKALKKPGTSITVQQLMAEYNIDTNIDQKRLDQMILEALNQSDSSVVPNTNSQSDVSGIKSPDIMSSFTSSKNQGEMTDMEGEVRDKCEMAESNVSRVLSSEMDSSISRVSECESSLNVVAKIDMLPFMGSPECEWDSSGMDSWSFRLLHARLRLHVRLVHRHDNAARTRVRADTRVRDVSVQRVHRDNEDKNSVASVCVGFAAEAMRRLSVQCARAGDVPALLRRAAAVARLARRWGHAMHVARLHLAYKLTDHGLTLNVANIPLRCVWEVHMKLEMVCDPEESVAWPRASDVRAKNVLTSETVSETRLRRALARVPAGWGQVPGAVWQIFRYLKNKKADDDELCI